MTISVRWLTQKLAITGQIDASNIPEIAEMGFKTVICNRPNFEYGADQPTAESVQAAAQAAGMGFCHLPVTPDGGTAADAKAMGELFAKAEAPVLAYCRTGGRCMSLIGVTARMGLPIPT
jgi:sulfide:quinone oxidoreductase